MPQPSQKKVRPVKKSGKRRPKSSSSPKTRAVARVKQENQFVAAYEPSVRSAQPRLAMTKSLSLSRCALKYAMAISEPFHPSARGACIPITGTETHKVTSFVRGDATIGLGGFGFIAVAPCLANDLPSVYYSNSTYAGTQAIILSAANTLNTGVSLSVAGGHPYSSGMLTLTNAAGATRAQGRVVATGLSAQYTGTLMNEAGMIYALRDPAHNNVLLDPSQLTGATTSTLANRSECQVAALSREKVFVRDYAFSQPELQFSTENAGSSASSTNPIYPFCNGATSFPTGTPGVYYTYTASLIVCGVPTNVIVFSGTVGQTIHFEYVMHAEYTGREAQSMVTPVESDPVGVDKVLCASSQIGERLNSYPQEAKPSGWEIMWEALSDVASKALPVAIPRMLGAAASLLM